MFGEPFRYLQRYYKVPRKISQSLSKWSFSKISFWRENSTHWDRFTYYYNNVFLEWIFLFRSYQKNCRHCTIMLDSYRKLLVNNSWQCHQKHDKMKLSFSDIEANIGKMRKFLKSEFGRDRKSLKFSVKVKFWRKLHFERLWEIFLGPL